MTMPTWDLLQCFLAVTQRGSLTLASQDLGVSIATLTRRMDTLEAKTGLRLLRRGPDGAVPTPDGLLLARALEPAALQLEDVPALLRSLSAGSAAAPVRLSATEPFVSDVLAPHVPELRAVAPDLRIELAVSNELANLAVGEADLAIRMVRPTPETLMARKLPRIDLDLFCSRGYLKGRAPSDLHLKDESLLWYDRSYGSIPENVWLERRGLSAATVARSTSTHALLAMAEAGAGITLLPVAFAERRGLVRLFADGVAPRQPWLVFHRAGHTAARLKTVRRWVVACCRAVFDPPDAHAMPRAAR